jgi:hypothetical protein
VATSRSLSTITEALYSYLSPRIGAAELSPRWRRQGDPLPYVTYEFTSASWAQTTSTVTNMVTLTVNFSCVAGTVAEALVVADDITEAFAVSVTEDSITFRMVDINMRTLDAVPDDGTGDAERIIVVTTTFLTHDET